VSTDSTTPAKAERFAKASQSARGDCKVGLDMAEEQEGARDEYLIDRPNRAKASSKTTKAIVALILLVSVALMVVITLGGWSKLQGAKPLQIAYILLYLVIAFFVIRWNRGVLPLAAALGIVLAIFAAVAGPGWFDRDRSGFAQPQGILGVGGLDSNILGLLTLLLLPVQVLLIAFSLQAFRQSWNVEVEVPADKATRHAVSPSAA